MFILNDRIFLRSVNINILRILHVFHGRFLLTDAIYVSRFYLLQHSLGLDARIIRPEMLKLLDILFQGQQLLL